MYIMMKCLCVTKMSTFPSRAERQRREVRRLLGVGRLWPSDVEDDDCLLPDVVLLQVVDLLLVLLHLVLAVSLELVELVAQLLLLLPELLKRVEFLGEHHDLALQLLLGLRVVSPQLRQLALVVSSL